MKMSNASSLKSQNMKMSFERNAWFYCGVSLLKSDASRNFCCISRASCSRKAMCRENIPAISFRVALGSFKRLRTCW